MIVAETGGDMSRFPDPAMLAAWCGLAPGNRESAGNRMRAGTRKGSKHLKAAMTESVWPAARTRSLPGVRFRRLARRSGKGNEKKVAVAVARTLLRIAWTVMARGTACAEQGDDSCERRGYRNREHPAASTPCSASAARSRSRQSQAANQHPPPDQHRTPPAGHPAGSAGAAARHPGVPEFRHSRIEVRLLWLDANQRALTAA